MRRRPPCMWGRASSWPLRRCITGAGQVGMATADGHPVAVGTTTGSVWLRTGNYIILEQEPERPFRLFWCSLHSRMLQASTPQLTLRGKSGSLCAAIIYEFAKTHAG